MPIILGPIAGFLKPEKSFLEKLINSQYKIKKIGQIKNSQKFYGRRHSEAPGNRSYSKQQQADVAKKIQYEA